MFRKRLI